MKFCFTETVTLENLTAKSTYKCCVLRENQAKTIVTLDKKVGKICMPENRF